MSGGRPGCFVAVVGPSGAGKDTIIAYARDRLGPHSGVIFVRRVITRPCDGHSEIHDTLDDAAFEQAREAGAFSVSWDAHGLRYGIPSAVDRDLEDGRVVVANVSRGALEQVRRRHGRLTIVEITARPEILAARIVGRGRERGEDAAARLTRAAAISVEGADVTVIDNSETKEFAGERLLAVLRELVAEGAGIPAK